MVQVPSCEPADPRPARSFVGHAKLISALTLVSRILGMGREVVMAAYFGRKTGFITDAFYFAWTVPNLFRKLFGEGALAAAFIPLYSQALKQEGEREANRFAAAGMTLLCVLLLILTVVGELVLWGISYLVRPDQILLIQLSAIMLPYVLLICGTAFLSGILQVHRRFGLPAAAPFVLNIIHIAVIICGAWMLGLHAHDPGNDPLKIKLVYWLAAFVLLAGALQVLMLVPAVRAVGFRFEWVGHFWTPAVRRMMVLTVPVALSAGVLQVSVLIDKTIPAFLAAPSSGSTFSIFGHAVRYPLEAGAVTRLNWAQILYQFPLGVFAVAIATAIFPSLSADALDADRQKFRTALRQGIDATLFEGLAASVGLMLVARPAVRVLFALGPHDTELVVRSTILYSSAIWAYSLQQVINRAYYSLHDMTTPFWMAVVTIVVNTLVEVPLLWTPLSEAGMAAGTAASFSVQALVMVWMLNRKVGGLEVQLMLPNVAKMVVATGVMAGACLIVQHSPIYPRGDGRMMCLGQLVMTVTIGGGVFMGLCGALGVSTMQHFLPRRAR